MLKKINFYHTVIGDLLLTSPPLINAFFKAKLRIIVASTDDEILEQLDAKLWTFSSPVFCPHGLESDPNPDLQPILLCNLNNIIKNINQANCLCLITNNIFEDIKKTQQVIDNFNEITTLICIFQIPETSTQKCNIMFEEQNADEKKYFIDISGKWQEYN